MQKALIKSWEASQKAALNEGLLDTKCDCDITHFFVKYSTDPANRQPPQTSLTEGLGHDQGDHIWQKKSIFIIPKNCPEGQLNGRFLELDKSSADLIIPKLQGRQQ